MRPEVNCALSLKCLLTRNGVESGLRVVSLQCTAETRADEQAVFFGRFCAECHSGSNPDAGLDLKELKLEDAESASFATWVRLFDRVRKEEMPPKDFVQPTSAERAGS